MEMLKERDGNVEGNVDGDVETHPNQRDPSVTLGLSDAAARTLKHIRVSAAFGPASHLTPRVAAIGSISEDAPENVDPGIEPETAGYEMRSEPLCQNGFGFGANVGRFFGGCFRRAGACPTEAQRKRERKCDGNATETWRKRNGNATETRTTETQRKRPESFQGPLSNPHS